MPARDFYHDLVRDALVSEGWTITHDPYFLSEGRGRVFVDLGAELPIGAEKGGSKIAVEVKSFRGESNLSDFERALGQFLLYRSLIDGKEPDRKLFLAVPSDAYENTFQDRITQRVLSKVVIPLIVFRPSEERIIQWIP